MKLNTHVIAQTENNLLSGVVVGTATTVASPFHEGSGNLIQEYVVRLDEPIRAENRDPVYEILVDPEGCLLGPWHVNIYEVDMGYGGPEEGGWWFSVYDLKHTEVARTYADAERRVEELRAGEWADDPDARVSSVAYSGGVYTAEISDKPGVSHDTYQSYC